MSNYLVTGGAGFIGSNIVDALVAQGEEVRVLDNFFSGFRHNIAHHGDKVELIEALAPKFGIEIVDESDRVQYHPIEIVSSSENGILVTGLPNELRLITVGQGFVNPGQTVNAIPDPDAALYIDDELSDRTSGGWVESGRGFVEQKHGRVGR